MAHVNELQSHGDLRGYLRTLTVQARPFTLVGVAFSCSHLYRALWAIPGSLWPPFVFLANIFKMSYKQGPCLMYGCSVEVFIKLGQAMIKNVLELDCDGAAFWRKVSSFMVAPKRGHFALSSPSPEALQEAL